MDFADFHRYQYDGLILKGMEAGAERRLANLKTTHTMDEVR